MKNVHDVTEPTLRIDQILAVFMLLFVYLAQGLIAVVPAEYLQLAIVPQIKMADMPIKNTQREDVSLARISANAYAVIDVNSAAILLSKDADKALYPASTTKLVTALIAARTFNPDEVWKLEANEMVEYSTVGLRTGDQVRVRDLMAALLIESDNAVAEIMAHRYPGGREAFMKAMNAYAITKKLHNTQFANPTGFDDPKQQLSAMDLIILSREVMLIPWLLELTSQSTAYIKVQRHDAQTQLLLVNTNKLLNSPLGIKGIKTGTTPAAGEVLVSLVENQPHPLLVVVMGSQSRFEDTRILVQWTLASYSWQSME